MRARGSGVAMVPILGLVGILLLAGCSSGTSSSGASSSGASASGSSAGGMSASGAPTGATAPSTSAMDPCSLLPPAVLQGILGTDPGAPTTADGGVSCTYVDLPLQFQVGVAGAYDAMVTIVEGNLARTGDKAMARPVPGVGSKAVSYETAAGSTVLIAADTTHATLAVGALTKDQLAAIDTALLAAMAAG